MRMALKSSPKKIYYFINSILNVDVHDATECEKVHLNLLGWRGQ